MREAEEAGGPPPPLPGGPDGTRSYRAFIGRAAPSVDGPGGTGTSGEDPAGTETRTGTPGNDAGRTRSFGRDQDGSWTQENGPGGGLNGGSARDGGDPGNGSAAPQGGGPGAYYSEWAANDPTATYSTIRDEAVHDEPGGFGERRTGVDDWDPEPARPRGIGALYEPFSAALSGLRERLRFRRAPRPGPVSRPSPAEVYAPSPLDTEFSGVAGYRVPFVSRPFLWCAGADPALIPNRSELYRYSTIGIFVCLVSFVATTMFAVFASVISGGFSPAILPFAAVWGVLIFWIDRSIVAEPSYGKVLSGTDGTGLLDPATRSRKPGWLTYVMRGILALGVSFIIAEAVTLLIFQSEVRDQLAFTQTARTDRLDAKFKAADEDKRKQLDAKYDRAELCATAKSKESTRNAALKKKQDESLGKKGEGLSGTIGFGPIATKLEADYNKAQREYVAAQGRCDLARDSVSRDFKQYQGDERASREAERVDVRRNTGWVAQEQALHDFIDNSGSPVVVALPWVLRITILLLDLLPLSVKLLGGPTVYERRLREQAYSQAYETQRLRDAHIAKIDMRYDLDRLNTRDTYDRGRDGIRNSSGRSVRGTRVYPNQPPEESR